MQIFKDKVITNYIPNKDSIVLDIETTGISKINSLVSIVGILDFYGNFTQFAINSALEENDILQAIFPYINNKNIITFNGKIFDLPFLKERFQINGLIPFEEKSQFDIYRYFIKNRKFTDIEKFSLQDIEIYCNIDRFENFEKSYDIDFYANYIEEDIVNENKLFQNKLKDILLHNKYDVLNTEKVLKLVNTIEYSKIFTIKKLVDFDIKKTVKINSIYQNNDILEIILDIDSKNELLHYYKIKNYEINISKQNIIFRTNLVQGFVSNDTLGYVHIIDDENLIKDASKYNLPNNILLITDGRYNLENIKTLVNYAFNNLKI